MNKKNFKTKILIIIIIFSIVGILISSMLTLAKYNDNVAILCGEDTSNNCNTVQNSEYSNLFVVGDETNDTSVPVPISLAGIFYYMAIIITSTMLLKKEKQKSKIYNILFGLSIFGLLFSIIYTLIQAFVIDAYCTYCLISAFDCTIIFIASTYLFFKK